jgi:iron complex outermembrane recepter protein
VLTYAHAQSDGYREHSALQRDVINWRSNFFVSEHKTLNINALYADIHYETPGGLTQAQMDKDPRLSRPTVGAIKGAIDQNAGIFQKLFQIGLSQEYRWNEHWQNYTSVYGTFNDFRNPFITNYEKRAEQTFGGRTRTTYQFDLGKTANRLSFGGEFGRTYSAIRNYGNRAGKTDTLQTDDEISAWQHFYFSQLETELSHGVILTIGASYNLLTYSFLRLSDAPKLKPIDSNFEPIFSPRIALLKNFHDKFSIFGSVSNGFSPPTVTEFATGYKTSSNFQYLNPENGTNYELGTRGNFFKNRVSFDATIYSLHLQNTIVRRQDVTGQDYYSNAGNTLQNGYELLINYLITNKLLNNKALSKLRFFTSFTYNDYHFKNYQQGKIDYSGNQLTGVPQQVWVSGIDAENSLGFYLNSTLNFTDKLPLNDANTVYANSYWLLTGRLGFKHDFKYFSMNIFTGIDNALNQLYSLGNDTNAAGNRYFNPAATRNYYFGGSFKFLI